MLTKKLKRMIDKSEIISFDIYDTLIKRLVYHPKDIFVLVEEKYNSINSTKIKNFASNRINAERIARSKSFSGEVTLADIYEEYKTIDSESDRDYLTKIEKNLEINLSVINNDIVDVLAYCKKQNKRTIIISDMYLDDITIMDILSRNNILYEKLYLSSKYNKKKSTGEIYKFVINDLNVAPTKILHIGDNYKSDYINAKLKGLMAYHFKRKAVKQNSDIKINVLNNYIDFKLGDKYDFYYNMGYRALGPLMFGFVNWLNNCFVEDKKNNIIFLAREGFFIKKCFETINNTYSTKYMYVSRKSATSSIIKNKKIDIDNIINIQSITLNDTVEMFLKRFGLINQKVISILNENNISLKDNYNDCKIKNKIDKLIPKFINTLQEKKDLFYQYIKQLSFSNDTAIVDIGWNGTMQDIIELELLNQGINIDGYYLGARKERKKRNKHGYLFDNDEYYEMISRGMVGLLEIIFSANHGTTKEYAIHDGEVRPILEEMDSSKSDMLIINKIQEGALDFINDFKKISISENVLFNNYQFCYNIIKLGSNPNLQETKMLNRLKVYNQKEKQLIGGKFFVLYMFNPRGFKSDFIDSGWKIAFLKNVFKININYLKIYTFLYKRRNR